MLYAYHFQACDYKTEPHGQWTPGIARVNGLDNNDVQWIMNVDGVKIKKIYDYRLTSFTVMNPFAYITIHKEM